MTFRNIDVSPDAPVEEWGGEGMLCALERGDVADWQRLYAACADVRAVHLRQTLAQALRVLERGDIHPQLADVFCNALNLEKLSNQPAFRETQDAFSKRLATQEQYGQGE